MDEKIRITIPMSVYEVLLKDAEEFKILHSDSRINLNQFLNMLISNYYLEFANQDRLLTKNILKALEPINDDYLKEEALKNIIKAFDNNDSSSPIKDKSKIISLKPTKLSQKAITHINNILVNNESMASYYRRLLISYTKKIQTTRERIIFKETFDLINEAIANKSTAYIALNGITSYNNASIYAIATPKDELYNYVLFECNNTPETIRLCNIKEIILLPTKATFSDDALMVFTKQIKYGPQYITTPLEVEPVKIRLTKRGIKLYKRIYLYRPEYDEVDGDIYTFNGPYNQITHYFKRFGNDAIVLSPKSVQTELRNFYYFANKEYKKFYND